MLDRRRLAGILIHMVNYCDAPESDCLNRVFAALADPTRRSILARVAEHDGVRVTELAAPFRDAMSLPAVSKHLRVLERAGLLAQDREGRVRHCHLRPGPLRDASDWLAYYRQFWTNQLESLTQYLERDVTVPSPPPKHAQP